jgi:hypothetical protein
LGNMARHPRHYTAAVIRLESRQLSAMSPVVETTLRRRSL